MLTNQEKVNRAAALIHSAKVDLDKADPVSIVMFQTANRAMERKDFVAASFFYKMAAQS
jgi:hypothetical protein